MNRKHAAAALSALALGAVAPNVAEASALAAPEPECGNTIPEPNCPSYDLWQHGNMPTPVYDYPGYKYPAYKLDVPTSPSDPAHASAEDTVVDVLPAGASALGAAGVGLGLWLYRRRRQPAA
ncbi:hypothetical protein [Kribbella sp. NBC_00359]|uniref:hypothetical protein n=1 Tax=Kribbella sp. NBC_00359 TaxID=2975966 RepID=UPI002E1A36EB